MGKKPRHGSHRHRYNKTTHEHLGREVLAEINDIIDLGKKAEQPNAPDDLRRWRGMFAESLDCYTEIAATLHMNPKHYSMRDLLGFKKMLVVARQGVDEWFDLQGRPLSHIA